MALETATFVHQLNPVNPTPTDSMKHGDDHIRMVKGALKATFPNITGAVTATHDEINGVAARLDSIETALPVDGSGAVSGDLDMNGHSIAGLPDPLTGDTAASKAYVDAVREALFPVGSVYITSGRPENPAVLLGFGTWASFGEGRVLIGAGSATDDNGETRSFADGDEDGTFSHELTVAELPPHSHALDYGKSGVNGGGGAHPSYLNITGYTTTTATTGNGEAHPNVQPSVAVRMWKRTA